MQKHLRLFGVEIFEQFDIPSFFMDIFDSIREVHSIFLRFQKIDLHLKNIKDEKTFIRWVDSMVGNKYLMCSLNKETNKIRKENLDNLISKANKQLKGIFNFIFNLLYISNNKGYMLSPPNYQAQAIDTLDLTIPANNFSVSEFFPLSLSQMIR